MPSSTAFFPAELSVFASDAPALSRKIGCNPAAEIAFLPLKLRDFPAKKYEFRTIECEKICRPDIFQFLVYSAPGTWIELFHNEIKA
jgi:hypothetical protein